MSSDRLSVHPEDPKVYAAPPGYTMTDWPCKKCGSIHVAERCDESSDGAYEDWHFRCLDCGHDWWEESSDY